MAVCHFQGKVVCLTPEEEVYHLEEAYRFLTETDYRELFILALEVCHARFLLFNE